MKKIHTHCFVAGHSGGHIIPCITLAQEKLTKHPQDRVLFFTTNASLDTQLMQSLGTSFCKIALPVTSITSHNPFKLMLCAINLLFAFITSMYHLMRMRPDSVTSTGGISTIPVACAAYLLRIPIDLYELNVLPGKTTSFLAPLARTIYCCFARTSDFLPVHICAHIGYPVRFFHEEQHSQNDACRLLKLDPHKKTVLILGGSQGSLFINNTIKHWITENSPIDDVHIIHQTGKNDSTDWYLFYKQHKIPAITFPFSDDMEQYYSAADLVISRSGAGSLFEVLYFHKPCITIPLELYNNAHQLHNAFTMAYEYPELFFVLTQSSLTENSSLLADTIDRILSGAKYNKKQHKQKRTPRTIQKEVTTS